jgi:hypothetical protein
VAEEAGRAADAAEVCVGGSGRGVAPHEPEQALEVPRPAARDELPERLAEQVPLAGEEPQANSVTQSGVWPSPWLVIDWRKIDISRAICGTVQV